MSKYLVFEHKVSHITSFFPVPQDDLTCGHASTHSSRCLLTFVLLVTEKVALLEKRVVVGLEAEPLAEPVRAAMLGAADGGD